MNAKDAIKACLDGEKVRLYRGRVAGSSDHYWDGEAFRADCGQHQPIVLTWEKSSEWKILEKIKLPPSVGEMIMLRGVVKRIDCAVEPISKEGGIDADKQG